MENPISVSTHNTVFTGKLHIRLVSLLLLAAFVNLFTGCGTYYRIDRIYSPEAQAINPLQKLNYINKGIYLIHEGYKISINKIFINTDQTAFTSTIYRKIPLMPYNHTGKTKAFYRANTQQQHIIYEIHIHVSEYSGHDSGEVTIPLSAVRKIEIFDDNNGVKIAAWVTIGATVLIIFFITLYSIGQMKKDIYRRFWSNFD
jgi:hypothetical protein